MNGRRSLAWELVIHNASEAERTIERVQLDAGAVGSANYEGDALRARMRWISDVDAETLSDLRDGIARTRSDAPNIVPSERESAFFGWLDFAADVPLPSAIDHRISIEGQDPIDISVPIDATPPRVFGPPLRGPGWVSFGSPSDDGAHRRTILRFGGRGFLAQRYAIDWGRVDDEGRLLRADGDPHRHADYAAYGSTVIAVADGVVLRVHDGVPEQSGEATDRAVPITLETVAGNYVIIDLGEGAYGVFAHLIPGSITVREGERVTRGRALGRLGSSGNATGPHLHFHLCDAPELLACEGIPYVFDRFAASRFAAEGETVEAVRFVRRDGPSSVDRELVRDEQLIDFAP